MPTDVTISSLSGSSPFDVYICNTSMSNCVYVDTITSGDVPYIFEVPISFSNSSEFNIKVIDNLNCLIIDTLVV